MKRSHVLISLIVIVFAMLAILVVSNQMGFFNDIADYNVNLEELTNELTIDNSNWSYDEENNIYYQLGIVYCTNPETTDYESMAIYVPGDYFKSNENSNGTYTCSVVNSNVGNYSATTAPIVMAINTPGYSAHASPTVYNPEEVKEFTDAGLVYVDAGCRGRENGGSYSGGAPWGVTDLKAAVLYLKFNGDTLPGDSEKIFSFGHSGGGAQSAVLGVSGDSKLYIPYLQSIGAPIVDRNGNKLSDRIYGSMCWCPVTSLDTADEAYEWTMGQYSSDGTRGNGTWTNVLSDDLALAYATYINDLHLKGPDGQTLSLNESDEGIYASGTYYDYMLSVADDSLNNFLKDTTFPYSSSSGVYQNPQEYIDSLNGDEEWITYNSSSNTAEITSIEAFVKHCKYPSKDVGAFDDLGRGQPENDLFGNDEMDSLHFDSIMANALNENSDKYSNYSDYDYYKAHNYASDLTKLDKVGYTIENRSNMYNPMYYLCDYYPEDHSHIAKYWRINSGIEQSDTSFTVEANLALALESCGSVDSVEFNEVWGQGHTQAERKGSPNSNFINWVNRCMDDNSDFFSFLF